MMDEIPKWGENIVRKAKHCCISTKMEIWGQFKRYHIARMKLVSSDVQAKQI
ncbi:hypothetical protein Scep_027469 [Stephania cephalantha]|uniref:Uncharacterized protein n=1 Tax=Stephania cephalantha TaxID=152367 RepID=A0AAP0EBF9_9MAGN